MAERIKPSQAAVLARVIGNPETAAQLSPAQLRSAGETLRQFQAEQSGSRTTFEEQGFEPRQVRQLVDAENAAVESGENLTGGDIKRFGAPGQGTIFGVSKLINSGAEGVTRFIEGAGDLVNEVGVGLNIQSREDADNFKASVNQFRLDRKLRDIDNFGVVNSRIPEVVGEIAPWFASGGVGGTGGILRYAMSQGVVGGLAGITQVSSDPIAERVGDFAIGAGLGAVFAGAFGAKDAIARAGARRFQKELNIETAANNVELEQGINDMLKTGEFGFSMSQLTGNRFLFGLEQRAAGAVQKFRQNTNIKLLFDDILSKAKTMGDAGRSADEIGLSLRSTLSEANKTIHKQASNEFAAGLDKLDEFGEDIILNYEGGQNYLGKLDDLVSELDDPLRPGPGATNAFKAYRRQVDRVVNPTIPHQRIIKDPKGGPNRIVYDLLNRRTGEREVLNVTLAEARTQSIIRNTELGGLQAGELSRVQRGLNDLLRGKTAVLDTPDPNTNKHMAKALMGSLMDNLNANNNNPLAASALTDITDAYKAQMLRVGKMEELVVNRMFGQAEMPFDSDKALDVVMGGGTSSLKNTRNFLEEWNPALLDELQGTLLRRIVSKAGDPASPSVDVPISLDKFAVALSGKGPNGTVVGQAGRGLFTPAMTDDLVKTGEALRTIKNLYFTGITPSPTTIDDLAINVISRSPEFMARFVTRAATTGKGLDGLMTDPLTRKALQRLAEGKLNTPKGRIAMLVLTNYITAQDGLEAEQAQQEGAQQNRNAINRTSNALQ